MSLILGQGVFITGTDTGVGKTVAAAALAGALRRRGVDAGVMKPFQTGAVRHESGWLAPDAHFLATVAGVDDPMELICPIMLDAPLAPSVAAALSGRVVSVTNALPAYYELCRRHSFVVVEGAGGLAVPIAGRITMRDLAAAMKLPVLIVARPGLGTLNHTALTVEYAHAGGLDIVGIVFSDYPENPGLAEQTNPDAVQALTGIPVLGLIPHDPDVDTERDLCGRIVEDMAVSPLLDRFLVQMSSLASPR